MYESPITQIIGEITNQMRECEEGRIVCEVSTAIGYDINKEELIKAMQYDRNQYEKGYKDGLAVLDKIRSEIVELQKDYHEYGWAYDDVLDIIDRYKAEGSESNQPETCRDLEEIKEIMECDTDTETKCKMIYNILAAKPHYFEKQE